MAQKLTGLEYLKANEIKGMKCDGKRPYVFLSYSHDEHDSQIVMNVFKKLYERGYNLWIDTANMPHDENSWKTAAKKALVEINCVLAFFFRSESSMIKETIAEELATIKDIKHIKKIITIDIWEKEGMDAKKYRGELLNSGSYDDKIENCEKICDIVKIDNKAIRLASDAGNDIECLINEMEEVMKDNGLSGRKVSLPTKSVTEVEASNKNEKLDNCGDGKAEVEETEEYIYNIFGKEYRAGKGKQTQLMYDAFEALIEKYPEKVEQLTSIRSVSRVEEVTNPGKSNARPDCFISYQKYTISGNDYLVGSSYNFDDKLREIRKMFKICEGTDASFELVYSPPKKKRQSNNGKKGVGELFE